MESGSVRRPVLRHDPVTDEQGKRVERVRITDEPPTPGQLYLLDNAKRNAALGEDIRNLRRV